jgi:hypothetical protein
MSWPPISEETAHARGESTRVGAQLSFADRQATLLPAPMCRPGVPRAAVELPSGRDPHPVPMDLEPDWRLAAIKVTH